MTLKTRSYVEFPVDSSKSRKLRPVSSFFPDSRDRVVCLKLHNRYLFLNFFIWQLQPQILLPFIWQKHIVHVSSLSLSLTCVLTSMMPSTAKLEEQCALITLQTHRSSSYITHSSTRFGRTGRQRVMITWRLTLQLFPDTSEWRGTISTRAIT